MKQLLGSTILAALLSLSAWTIEARADHPDAENPGKHQTWVYRRNKAEKNNIDAICTAIRLDGKNTAKISGTLTIWTMTTTDGKKYDGKKVWTLPEVSVNKVVTDSRSREYCRWDSTTVLPIPVSPNTDQIRVYASLFKGNDKSKGHNNRRLVVRCYKGAMVSKDFGTSPCDQEPDDDVLEEEPTDPGDQPPYDGDP